MKVLEMLARGLAWVGLGILIVCHIFAIAVTLLLAKLFRV